TSSRLGRCLGSDQPPIRITGLNVPVKGPNIGNLAHVLAVPFKHAAFPIEPRRDELAQKTDCQYGAPPLQIATRDFGFIDTHEAALELLAGGFACIDSFGKAVEHLI